MLQAGAWVAASGDCLGRHSYKPVYGKGSAVCSLGKIETLFRVPGGGERPASEAVRVDGTREGEVLGTPAQEENMGWQGLGWVGKRIYQE